HLGAAVGRLFFGLQSVNFWLHLSALAVSLPSEPGAQAGFSASSRQICVKTTPSSAGGFSRPDASSRLVRDSVTVQGMGKAGSRIKMSGVFEYGTGRQRTARTFDGRDTGLDPQDHRGQRCGWGSV